MDTSEKMFEMAKSAFSISARWKFLQGIRDMAKVFSSTYDAVQVELDKAEYEADEDLEKLAKLRHDRDKYKGAGPALDNLMKTIEETEDKLIPDTIAFFDAMLNLEEADK